MQILVNADNRDNAGELVRDRIRDTVGAALRRYGVQISRAEVQLTQAQAVGDDMPVQRCRIELRLRGCQPLSVEHAARSIELAIDGALYRLTRVIDGAREGTLVRAADEPDESPDTTGFGAAT